MKGIITVIGDVMLDEYIYGRATRISPEAPVPIVEVYKKVSTLGGAGNVALNIYHLGYKPWLFGVRGDDSVGGEIVRILQGYGIPFWLDVVQDFQTTRKTRIIANGQQLLRYDEERLYNGNDGSYDFMLEKIFESLEKSDVVILSDYYKGVVVREVSTAVISRCKTLGIPVLVDPKNPDWRIFSGADLIKPNVYEFESATKVSLKDDKEIETLGLEVLNEFNFGSILFTRGSKGMVLIGRDGCNFIPSVAREVFDVSGAGDTTIATFAVCLCKGYDFLESSIISNRAAGIVVGKLGTCPIKREELGFD